MCAETNLWYVCNDAISFFKVWYILLSRLSRMNYEVTSSKDELSRQRPEFFGS